MLGILYMLVFLKSLHTQSESFMGQGQAFIATPATDNNLLI